MLRCIPISLFLSLRPHAPSPASLHMAKLMLPPLEVLQKENVDDGSQQQVQPSAPSVAAMGPGCALPIMLQRDEVDRLPSTSPIEKLYRYMWRRKVRLLPSLVCPGKWVPCRQGKSVAALGTLIACHVVSVVLVVLRGGPHACLPVRSSSPLFLHLTFNLSPHSRGRHGHAAAGSWPVLCWGLRLCDMVWSNSCRHGCSHGYADGMGMCRGMCTTCCSTWGSGWTAACGLSLMSWMCCAYWTSSITSQVCLPKSSQMAEQVAPCCICD